MLRVAVVILACVAPAVGCSSCDDPRRAQARLLLDALQALDVAASPARREAGLDALRRLPLDDPDLARTRDGCVTVHAGLAAAEHEQGQARDALARAAAHGVDGGLSASTAEQVRTAIARSEQARERALAALPECERATRDLLLRSE